MVAQEDGGQPISGVVESIEPNEDAGGWSVRLRGDDGNLYSIDASDGALIRPEPVGDGSQAQPVSVEDVRDVQIAEQQVNTEPSEAQKEAGNYRHGHLEIQGLDIAIENPAGSVRSGVDKAGNPWSNAINHTYGYIKDATAKDGDKLDVFIGPDPMGGQVFVIDQIDPDTGSYDEGKVMLGFSSEQEAIEAYQSNYSAGWKGAGAITGMDMPAFKAWIAKGDTRKPLAYVKPKPAPKETSQPSTGTAVTGGAQPQPLNRGSAIRLAASLTKNDFPSDAVPHPTQPGMWAVVPKGEEGAQGSQPAVPRETQNSQRPAPVAQATLPDRTGQEPQQPSAQTAAAALPSPQASKKATSRPRTLIAAIAKRGGINRSIMQDVGADPKGRYAPGLFTKNGTTDLSELAEYLFNEDGFAQIRQDSEIGPARELEELLVRALGGEQILTAEAMERGMQSEQNAEIMVKAKQAGIKTAFRKIDDIAAELAKYETETLEKAGVLDDTDAELAYLDSMLSDAEEANFSAEQAQQFVARPMSDAEVSAWLGEDHVSAVTENQGTRQEAVAGKSQESRQAGDGTARQQEGFGLQQQTREDLTAKTARAADESIANRAAADRERDVFALTPQTQEKTQGATAQGGLFTPTGEASQQAKESAPDEVSRAKEVLDAAGITGTDRTTTIAAVRRGDLTAEEVAEAHGKNSIASHTGNVIYGVAAGYAHNTGQVFVGDPAGLSPVAFVRRLENMISSALKYGATDHLYPHAAQIDPKTYYTNTLDYPDFAERVKAYGLKWREGDFSHNLSNMLETSYNIAKDFYPDIENFVYDFDRRTFVDQRTDEPVDREGFKELSKELRAVKPTRYSGGSATLARAALFNTLLRGEGGSGWPRIVAGLGDQLSGRGLDPALKRLFYSKTSPSNEGLSVSDVKEAIAGPLAKLKNIPDVRVVQDQSEIPEVEAKLKSAAERFLKDGDKEALRELESFDLNPVEGAYVDGTLWIVAGSIKTADRARAVLAHEAVGHMSVEQMLDAADTALMPRLIKNVKLLDKAGNRYIRELAAAVDKTQPGLSADQRAKEIIAQIAERGDQGKEMTPIVRNLWRKIIDGIKAFYKLVFDQNLTDQDVRDIVATAERWAQGDEHVTAEIDGTMKSMSLSRRDGAPPKLDLDGRHDDSGYSNTSK